MYNIRSETGNFLKKECNSLHIECEDKEHTSIRCSEEVVSSLKAWAYSIVILGSIALFTATQLDMRIFLAKQQPLMREIEREQRLEELEQY